jgi:hypothetical protein
MDELSGRVQNLEKDMRLVLADVGSLKRTIHGKDGEGGLLARFNRFITAWETRESDKGIYDDRQSRKINMLIALATLIFLGISTLVSVWVYEHATHHALKLSITPYTTASTEAIINRR